MYWGCIETCILQPKIHAQEPSLKARSGQQKPTNLVLCLTITADPSRPSIFRPELTGCTTWQIDLGAGLRIVYQGRIQKLAHRAIKNILRRIKTNKHSQETY
jgi:hypothetical protein